MKVLLNFINQCITKDLHAFQSLSPRTFHSTEHTPSMSPLVTARYRDEKTLQYLGIDQLNMTYDLTKRYATLDL